MSRGWTFLDEDNVPDDKYDEIHAEADALAREWSRIHDEEEQENWYRQSDIEDGMYNPEIEEGMENIFSAQEKVLRMMREAKMDAIEKRMDELGVRMMRPYEHWNEDERYMQYMENRGY